MLFEWGLFDIYGAPLKPFYAFKAMREILETPERAFTLSSEPDQCAAIAGRSQDQSQAAILLSSFGTAYGHCDILLKNVPWKGSYLYEKYVLDRHHDLAMVRSEKVSLPDVVITNTELPPFVCLIRLKKTLQ